MSEDLHLKLQLGSRRYDVPSHMRWRAEREADAGPWRLD